MEAPPRGIYRALLSQALWSYYARKRAISGGRREACGRAAQRAAAYYNGHGTDPSPTSAPQCTLLVYVDDAISRLMALHFTATESTFSYFEATRRYLERHGYCQLVDRRATDDTVRKDT
ncbi:hypothetical protein [Paraburkholderia sp. SIMBA_030]|uniref:hypothetical protein n=1 Tax=Paraburkholderia sp. SIMBA_030 TaxID=3085773 RepID=UPI00397DFCFF